MMLSVKNKKDGGRFFKCLFCAASEIDKTKEFIKRERHDKF